MKKITASIVLLVLLIISILSSSASADQNETVSVTTKINVCGDDQAEGPEECDNSDLNDLDCISLGYSGGSLSCDAACDYDVSGCYFASPTNPQATQEAQADNYQPLITPESTNTTTERIELPSSVQSFDTDGDGRLSSDELFSVVKSWFDSLKTSPTEGQECDVNSDGRCNLVDFSVLMYYVER